jgi:hypothetical protein
MVDVSSLRVAANGDEANLVSPQHFEAQKTAIDHENLATGNS